MKLLLFILFFIVDSAITSINFWQLSENLYVKEVGESTNREINNKIIQFLNNESYSEVDRFSMANAVGWRYNSDYENAKAYKQSLEWETATTTQKYIYAYLLSFDNYFDITKPLEIISNNSPKSVSQHLISVILFSHDLQLKGKWKKIFPYYDSQLKKILLSIDSTTENINKKIEEYLILYKK